MKKELTLKEAQSKGGKTTFKRYGSKRMKELQKLGVIKRKLNKQNNGK